ncbi:hypothetical protein GIY11_00295 [Aerococcaceae bacterium DSM 109653]|uniref:PepSY domain-containing protein n=1 Tax=Fundicoccus ignavus TaxID=2664442 RepID=A0A844BYM5_9LACT|nr:hypothetical protein [Fundicoccus ignavus]MRI80471.1 hypothetical protein [Fundicoccus ignavus]
MKNKIYLSALFAGLLLSGCASNEANIVETTADSFNETPIVVESVKEIEETSVDVSSVESDESSMESSEAILSEESLFESIEESSSETPASVEESEEVVEPEPILFTEAVYTDYQLENELVEEPEIDAGMRAVIKYLKENNHYFDSAEYHFTILNTKTDGVVEITIAEQYSDGEIVRGVFEYDTINKTLELIRK